jgi:hypothetical protein
MTSRDELWAAVHRRKAEHAAGQPITPAPWEDHTCHTECPCHTGERPLPDFIEREDER